MIFDEQETQTRQVGKTKCGSPGDTKGHEVTDQYEGSLTIKGNIKGVEVEGTGKISHSVSRSTTYNFGQGNGCGQCKAELVHDVYRSQGWKVEKWFLFECYASHEWVSCVDSTGTSTSTCDRTDCD